MCFVEINAMSFQLPARFNVLDICFCVVLYNRKISYSETINSLSKNLSALGLNYEVIVFNNGPDEVGYEELPSFFRVHQVLINGSLSKLYNKTISLYQANKYVFLDDDTHVTLDYLKEISSLDFKVLFPKIFCDGVLHYPVFLNNGVQSITSGLAISHSAIQEISAVNGFVFDEAFDLYGIDTAFCYFINKHAYPYLVAESSLNHELSHISGGSGEFRRGEVLLANSAALVNYFRVHLLMQVLSSLLWAISKGKFKLLFNSVFSFLSRKVVR